MWCKDSRLAEHQPDQKRPISRRRPSVQIPERQRNSIDSNHHEGLTRQPVGERIGFKSKDAIPAGSRAKSIEEGAALPGAKEWRVLSVPGHSDDSTCFYHAASRTLLSGDAVLTHNGRAWFNPEIVDAGASAQTEERLRALDVEHLLPGHGLPISGTVWKNALSFHERPQARGLVARCLRRISK